MTCPCSCCPAVLFALWLAVSFWSVLPCAVLCPWVLCCAALLGLAPSGAVLLCAALFCHALFSALCAVLCPGALAVALGSCDFQRCVLSCLTVLCALCCVRFALVCPCVLLFAAVLCAVCVLGCPAVRSLSSALCAVLRCAVLVRLCRALCLVCAVSGPWCCGALLSVVRFPVVLCCAAARCAVSSCGLLCCAAALGAGGWLPCCVVRVAVRPCSPLVPCLPVLFPVAVCFGVLL